VSGSYPRKILFDIDGRDYYANYLSTYVERDVRLLKNITNLDLFQKFIFLVAGRVGQLFNQSSLGNELGVDNKTINSWMSLLETSYIAYRLYPYHSNFNKRITIQVYFPFYLELKVNKRCRNILQKGQFLKI
jgi:predicted AAA+ superfamily ATPase